MGRSLLFIASFYLMPFMYDLKVELLTVQLHPIITNWHCLRVCG